MFYFTANDSGVNGKVWWGEHKNTTLVLKSI